MGKFRRDWPVGTRHVDYNGRLCMVCGGVPIRKIFGVDRSLLPGATFPRRRCWLIVGANVGECTDHDQLRVGCRDNGGKLIITDPTDDSISRNVPTCIFPSPGPDLIPAHVDASCRPRDGLEDKKFIADHTTGFEAFADSVRDYERQTASIKTGVPAESIEKARIGSPRPIGRSRCTPRGSTPFEGRREVLSLVHLAVITGISDVKALESP